MARTTKALSGGGKDKVFRGVVGGVDGLDGTMIEAVTDALSEAITEVRVRREVWDALREAADTAPILRPPSVRIVPEAKTAAPMIAAPAFDPYAFSAIAVFTKQGAAGLSVELGKIAGAADLQALAAAQHLGVDPAMTDVAALRAAIVSGVERRIADRKAAAS